MQHINRPFQLHATSRYACVTEGVIEKLQQDYFAGRDLGQTIPDISATEAAVIVAESLEADWLWNTPPDELFGGPPVGPLSDWGLATMAELFFGVAGVAQRMKNEGQARDFWALAWAMLEQLLKSPALSPMLWYEDIFLDVGQELRIRGQEQALWFYDQALAYDLHHNDADNADSLLRDLAGTYLWLDDLDTGLTILTTLLRNDPADIWTYNTIALTFDRFGLTELGTEAAERGLELLEATGDPEKLRDQLVNALADMDSSERHGREAYVAPALLADLRVALALDFDAGQHRPIEELCRELVPDLDQMPVKRLPEKPDLPPPDEFMPRLEARRSAKGKLSRNDPCWCGSGKKYKRCHMRLDLRKPSGSEGSLMTK
jgi:tetratricopeptide (TPR) repeat protein